MDNTKIEKGAKALLKPYERKIVDKLFEKDWHIQGGPQKIYQGEINIMDCTQVLAYLPEDRNLWCMYFTPYIDRSQKEFKYLEGVNMKDIKRYIQYQNQIFQSKDVFTTIRAVYGHCRKDDLKNVSIFFSGEMVPGLIRLKYENKTLQFIMAPMIEGGIKTFRKEDLNENNTYFVK